MHLISESQFSLLLAVAILAAIQSFACDRTYSRSNTLQQGLAPAASTTDSTVDRLSNLYSWSIPKHVHLKK